jgi:hypothetical protein
MKNTRHNLVDVYYAGRGADWGLDHLTPNEFIAQGDRVVVFNKLASLIGERGKVEHNLYG